jgi:hypothetical protein
LGRLQQVGCGLSEQRIAIVVKEPRLVSTTEATVRSIPMLANVDVLAPSRLRRANCFDHIFIVGPAHRVPDYVITASRAPNIHIVRYDCIRDVWQPRDSFPNPIRRGTIRWSMPDTRNDLGVDDEIPQFDMSRIEDYARATDTERAIDGIEAQPFVLADDWIVLVETDPNAYVLGIDLNTEDLVERIPVGGIVPGVFVLLRTEGGGDYIVPLADRILGRRASDLRNSQERWKALLRDHVFKHGLLNTAISLIDRGSRRANEQNLRNWISPRFIRPNYEADFTAIMSLIQMAELTDSYWAQMGRIRSAHRQAGNQIRRQLLREVQAVDLEQLEESGRMDFQLPGVDGGTLTAFRVEEKLPHRLRVAPSRIDRPFRMVSSPWRG